MKTLPCLNPAQFKAAHDYLASRVATMMGRKFEEGDWACVYCAAKSIPLAGWSNLAIDVFRMHGVPVMRYTFLSIEARSSMLIACCVE